LHITLEGDLPLRVAHAVTERVEAVVAEILPGADVVVHPEPRPAPPEKGAPKT
jgi:divalent metal cation (Fe/Co/Zn/Cd) transporter